MNEFEMKGISSEMLNYRCRHCPNFEFCKDVDENGFMCERVLLHFQLERLIKAIEGSKLWKQKS